jgi:hypothetical protein
MTAGPVGPVSQQLEGGESRPIGELLSDLWTHTNTLVHQEVELVLVRLDDRVDEMKTDLKVSSIGAAALHVGLLAFAASMTLLLSYVVEPWLAALIVAAVSSLAGYLVLRGGAAELKSDVRDTAREATHPRSLKRST